MKSASKSLGIEERRRAEAERRRQAEEERR